MSNVSYQLRSGRLGHTRTDAVHQGAPVGHHACGVLLRDLDLTDAHLLE